MKYKESIITVGLSPSWDHLCLVNGVDWQEHKLIDQQITLPAGKALNVSRALAWMKTPSTAAGLWGKEDYPQMIQELAELKRLIKIRFTKTAGSTRRNINIIDTRNQRDMHLRSTSELSSEKSLKNLRADLLKLVNKNAICVFSGSLGNSRYLPAVFNIIKSCKDKGARLAIDTSGSALNTLLKEGGIWLLKPNVQELQELLGEPIKDTSQSLVQAGVKLLDRVDNILISRGVNGALLITNDCCYQAQCLGTSNKPISTVGCGDFLLAGFLMDYRRKFDLRQALKSGIQAATARTWGLVDKKSWSKVQKNIKVSIEKIDNPAKTLPKA